jgi:hypothetical protein
MKKNYNLKIKRKEMVESGAYDGRFRVKVVIDKKKQTKKTWSRQKGISDEEQNQFD